MRQKNGKEEYLWMAEPLVKAVLKKGRYQDFKIIEKKKGAELIGWEYDSPLPDMCRSSGRLNTGS